MIAALLIELEGVLVGTLELRRAALAAALADSGVMLDDRTWRERCAGLSVRSATRAAFAAMDRASDETELELVALRAERAFSVEAGKGVVLAPGARAFVESAHGRTRLALVTRAGRRDTELLPSLAGFADAFGCVVTADHTPGEKPDPAPYRLALARLARLQPLDATCALALEDELPGIRSARAAGLACIAVGGLPAYRAVEANGYLPGIDAQTPETLSKFLSGRRQRSE